MALRTFTLSHNHHYLPSPELFNPPKLKFHAHRTITLHSPLSSASGDHHSAFCLCEFDFSKASYGDGIIKSLSFLSGFFFLPLSVVSSRFIQIVVRIRISLLFEAKLYPIVGMYYILFIHSSINGRLNCFHLWLFIVHIAVNGHRCASSVWVLLSVLWGLYSEVGLLDHMVILCLTTRGAALLFSETTSAFYIPDNDAQGSRFSTSLPRLTFRPW